MAGNDSPPLWERFSPLMVNLNSEREKSKAFDGNRSDVLAIWMFPTEDIDFSDEMMMYGLFEMTKAGQLDWALFLKR